MGDTFYCRVKVTGPDTAEYHRLLEKTIWQRSSKAIPYAMLDWSAPRCINRFYRSDEGRPADRRGGPVTDLNSTWSNAKITAKRRNGKIHEVVLVGTFRGDVLAAYAKTKPVSDETVRKWHEIDKHYFNLFCATNDEKLQSKQFREERKAQRALFGPRDMSDMNTWGGSFDAIRVGPGLFDHLRIKTQVVGWMYSCDHPNARYSERTELDNGTLVSEESEYTLALARKYAADGIKEFPVENPEWGDDGAGLREINRREAREYKRQQAQWARDAKKREAGTYRPPSEAACPHGIPYPDGKDNGCKPCAVEARAAMTAMLHGIVARPAL
jgi:hypothetical protein